MLSKLSKYFDLKQLEQRLLIKRNRARIAKDLEKSKEYNIAIIVIREERRLLAVS